MAIELSLCELDSECSELLPSREALGLFNLNVANILAGNSATSANVLSLLSGAGASATQGIAVVQVS